MADKGFNADEKTAALLDRPVTIEGVVYKPRRKTGAVVKQILQAAPPEKPEGEEQSMEEQVAAIDALYQQCSILLEDDQGKQPDPEKLSAELDMEIARDMIRFLMPQADTDAAGND